MGKIGPQFRRDLALYSEFSARQGMAAKAAAKGKAKEEEAPFVARVALLLDPSMLEQARRAARKFHGDVGIQARKLLRQTLVRPPSGVHLPARRCPPEGSATETQDLPAPLVLQHVRLLLGGSEETHRMKPVPLEPNPLACFTFLADDKARIVLLRNSLDLHGGAVGQDFRDALHDFRGVVAHGDDGVGAVFGGVLHH